jgi:hypothetical protein
MRCTRNAARQSRIGELVDSLQGTANMRQSVLAAIFVVGIASVGNAAPILPEGQYSTYHLEGVVTFAFFDHSPATGDPLAALVPLGSQFTIDAIVDLSNPGFFTADGRHLYDALVGLTFNLNGLTYTMTSPNTNPFTGGMTYTPTSIQSPLSSAAFTGPAIVGALPGGEFLFDGDALTQSGRFYADFFGPQASSTMGLGRVFGQVTSVDVPEPPTILLISSGLLIIGLRSRLRKFIPFR